MQGIYSVAVTDQLGKGKKGRFRKDSKAVLSNKIFCDDVSILYLWYPVQDTLVAYGYRALEV